MRKSRAPSLQEERSEDDADYRTVFNRYRIFFFFLLPQSVSEKDFIDNFSSMPTTTFFPVNKFRQLG